MAHNAKYGVKFVGYSAHVIRKGREVEYAALDFVTGRASVGNLPTLSTELQQRFCRRSIQVSGKLTLRAAAKWSACQAGGMNGHHPRPRGQVGKSLTSLISLTGQFQAQ
jgi:hypothetical protein